MAQDDRELDLDIITTSWRSLSDGEAYGQMVQAWERKLAAASKKPRLPLVDTVLRRQLDSIDKLLDDNRRMVVEDPLELAVSQLPTPTMVLSPEGLVAALNERAGDYFGVKQGLRAGTDWLRDEGQSDYNAVRRSAAGGGNIDYAIVRVNMGDQDAAIAEVERLDVEGTEGSYTVVRSLELDWYDSVSTALEKAFGLTKAETEVARLVFMHRDLERVAKARSAKLETVRTQMKRILAKVEVHSKTELMRLLALLCARAAANHNAKDLTWSDPLGRETFFIRKDGRKLGHSWVGAENGRPILFVPGQSSFIVFPDAIRRRLKSHDIKLICLSAPGFGNSELAIARDQLVDASESIEEFIESVTSNPIPVVATRGAQYYVTYLAKLRPDIFSALLLIGLPWNLTDRLSDSIDPENRTLLRLLLNSPIAYEMVVRLGYRLVKRHGPDFYWRRDYRSNWADIATSNNVELIPFLRAMVQHSGNQGHIPFVREQGVCAANRVSEWIRNLEIPIHWMVPALTIDLDRDGLDEISALSPISTLEIVADTGKLLPFQAPETFLQRLLDLVDTNPGQTFRKRFGRVQ